MSSVTFADVVHQSISFSLDHPAEALILKLVDTKWFQRLRDISQTANTRLVYMFSEHSRFGHSVGVAYLANQLMRRLELSSPKEVAPYRCAVSAAALLHDIGHLAPGSHTAFKTWFPGAGDVHEKLATRIISESKEIRTILEGIESGLVDKVIQILNEDPSIPPWSWEILSGGGWNVDRGNWCAVDSVMAGVSYGVYNIPAIADSILLTKDGNLALRENRLDAMMHFAVSRHAMYRQLYQHRVLLSADTLNRALVQRARDIGDKLSFADKTMRLILESNGPDALSLDTIFNIRESWWRYHITRWQSESDQILSDLCCRLLNRGLFKTVRIARNEDESKFRDLAEKAVVHSGFDPKYYLHRVSSFDVHQDESDNSLRIVDDDGRVTTLAEADPLYKTLINEGHDVERSWFVMPAEAKELLGRKR